MMNSFPPLFASDGSNAICTFPRDIIHTCRRASNTRSFTAGDLRTEHLDQSVGEIGTEEQDAPERFPHEDR